MAKSTEKKKMVDIARPAPKHQIPKPLERDLKGTQTLKKTDIEKKLKKDFKKLEKKIEQFEEKAEERFEKEEEVKKRKRFHFRKLVPTTYILLGLLLILVGAGVYSAVELLPKATIKITTKKTDWNYVNSVVADKSITKIDASQKQVPAEIFSAKKNFNFSFAATGKKSVEEKAKGKITIYNAYSSDPQTLVANTRFSSSDAKTFRLDKKIVVPGAKIVEGKITPSSIEATVTADQPGPNYNIGPVSRFSIPGFQGSPKYQAFYASSQEPMKGGFIGERAFPTDGDIKNAKEKAVKDLKDYIESYLSLQIPPEFKVIDGSKQFNVLKQEINTQVDESNNFTVFVEGELSSIAFKESDLKNLMEAMAQSSLGTDFKIKDYKLDYGAGRPDFKNGKLSFSVNFSGTLEEPINTGSFKQQALNKTENDLKVLVFSLPNVQKATISFWPFWVKRAPDDLKRVSVEVE